MINNFSPECTDFMKVEKIGNNLSITSYVVMAEEIVLSDNGWFGVLLWMRRYYDRKCSFLFFEQVCLKEIQKACFDSFPWDVSWWDMPKMGSTKPTTPHHCFLKVSSMWTTSSVSQSTSSPSIQILLTCKRESFLKMWYIKYYLVFHKTQQFFRNNFLLREVRFIIQYTDSIAIALIPLCGLSDNVKFFVGVKVRRLIQEAMHHYEEETCIRFVPRTNQKDYIVYVYQPG